MIKLRAGPTIGCMTRFTIIGTEDMTGGFSQRRSSIVTTGADTFHLGMIHAGYFIESVRGMTGLAVFGSGDMIHRFCHRGYKSPLLMTQGTLSRRIFKNSAGVAFFAQKPLMRSG
jgi:hypothetical protein